MKRRFCLTAGLLLLLLAINLQIAHAAHAPDVLEQWGGSGLSGAPAQAVRNFMRYVCRAPATR